MVSALELEGGVTALLGPVAPCLACGGCACEGGECEGGGGGEGCRVHVGVDWEVLGLVMGFGRKAGRLFVGSGGGLGCADGLMASVLEEGEGEIFMFLPASSST